MQKISTSEWKVMEILWAQPNVLASDIITNLRDTSWSDKTIKTLLSRLVKKNLINYCKEGKSYRYYPVIDKKDCVEKEKKDFINKIFHGSSKDFMASFIKNEDLSKEDIAELRALLNNKEDQ